MNNRLLLFLLAWLGSISFLSAQTTFTQTIRGRVIDARCEEALVGATVQILGSDPLMATVVDTDGNFEIKQVPVGRHSLFVSFVGYLPAKIPNLLLTSSKELVLEVKLEESVIALDEVVVSLPQNKDRAANQFAPISARAFTVEETERYAGSLGDPSRMVANYAGVMGVDDMRNDIVIRGNSPSGVLWRLDGVDVPNPNHFASEGATGGPISMINNNLLANSDFFTGAFPAEYGNALSGAFDLKLRNGNNHKYEFLGQVGFGGFELGAEGPFSKKSPASFIIHYRYSTLAALKLLGINFDVGTGGAIPYYQDLNFKVNIPTKRAGRFELFGLGGLSHIAILGKKQNKKKVVTLVSESDIFNKANTGVIGLKHTYYFPNESKIISKLASTVSESGVEIDSLFRNGVEETWRFYAFNSLTLRHSAEIEYSQKIGAKNYIATGLKGELVQYSLKDSIFLNNEYQKRFNDKGNYMLAKGYCSWQHRFTDQLTLNSGLFGMFFPLNKSWALEPRLSIRYQIAPKHSISAAFGMHSQTQIPALYFLKTTDDKRPFRDLDFNRAIHAVLGYDWLIAPDFRLKIETYYQHLYDIPVSKSEQPQFSMINVGDDFVVQAQFDMENKGLGRNYGVELTLEKFLSKGYYFLLTTSLFDSKYLSTDGVWRNTRFNGQYVVNLLGGYEFAFSSKSRLLIDLKGVYAGGKWQNPIDIAASTAKGELAEDWSRAYSEKNPDYFKLNARVSFRLNSKRNSQEWALEIQNITNKKNVYKVIWDPKAQSTKTVFQQGFMPMMTYRITF